MSQIHPDLASLAYPVAQLEELPGNPRKGDVPAIVRSYQMFGQRKPIVARKQGEGGIVLAGNHQLKAARELGWDQIAVVWVDDDDITAAAFSLADNRTGELGTYDDELLALMVGNVASDLELLAATGYSEKDVAALLGTAVAAPDQETQLVLSYAVLVTCADEAEQLALLERFADEGLAVRALTS